MLVKLTSGRCRAFVYLIFHSHKFSFSLLNSTQSLFTSLTFLLFSHPSLSLLTSLSPLIFVILSPPFTSFNPLPLFLLLYLPLPSLSSSFNLFLSLPSFHLNLSLSSHYNFSLNLTFFSLSLPHPLSLSL